MKTEVRKSGLVVPEESKPEPKKRGYLEIENDTDRRLAHAALQSLVHLTGSWIAPDQARIKAQKRLVRQLAELLLGDDIDFEERT